MGLRIDPTNAMPFCIKQGKAMLSKGQAKSTAKRMARVHRNDGTLDAYKCSTCGKWHVGNRKKRKGSMLR